MKERHQHFLGRIHSPRSSRIYPYLYGSLRVGPWPSFSINLVSLQNIPTPSYLVLNGNPLNVNLFLCTWVEIFETPGLLPSPKSIVFWKTCPDVTTAWYTTLSTSHFCLKDHRLVDRRGTGLSGTEKINLSCVNWRNRYVHKAKWVWGQQHKGPFLCRNNKTKKLTS